MYMCTNVCRDYGRIVSNPSSSIRTPLMRTMIMTIGLLIPTNFKHVLAQYHGTCKHPKHQVYKHQG